MCVFLFILSAHFSDWITLGLLWEEKVLMGEQALADCLRRDLTQSAYDYPPADL